MLRENAKQREPVARGGICERLHFERDARIRERPKEEREDEYKDELLLLLAKQFLKSSAK